jgi:hypothetical protein
MADAPSADLAELGHAGEYLRYRLLARWRKPDTNAGDIVCLRLTFCKIVNGLKQPGN